MTSMREALREAGLDAEENLRRIATEAWLNNAGSKQWDSAVSHVKYAVMSDARLLWKLFEPFHDLAIRKLLENVKAKLHADEKARVAEEQRASMPPATNRVVPAAPSPSGGQRTIGNHEGVAASERGALAPANTTSPLPLARPAAGDSGRLSVARSVLDTMLIDIAGRDGSRISTPIGKCTPRQANSWADKRVLDTRFIRMITANVPPDDLIGKWVDGHEANAIWQRAIEAHRDAA